MSSCWAAPWSSFTAGTAATAAAAADEEESDAGIASFVIGAASLATEGRAFTSASELAASAAAEDVAGVRSATAGADWSAGEASSVLVEACKSTCSDMGALAGTAA
jgi:hypothetical protein